MIDVRTYYKHTRFDYRVIWDRTGVPALHFGYYDAHADKHANALNNMNRAMAERAGICAGERVLDAGCGVGNAAFWLTDYVGARVTGLSIVPEQIVDARRYAARRKGPSPDFVVGDFLNIPFVDDHFDVVWACESFCHATDKGQFFREAFRVLRPGGRLIIADYVRAGRPLADEQEALLRDWLRPQAIRDIGTEAEYRSYAGEAGFSSFTAADITPNVRVSLRNLHNLCKKWLLPGRIFLALGIVNDVRFRNVIASIRQYEALQMGAWRYGMMCGVKEALTPPPTKTVAPNSAHTPL